MKINNCPRCGGERVTVGAKEEKLHAATGLPRCPPPPTPECDKLIAVSADSQKIGEFLEWLGEQHVHLAQWVEEDGRRPALIEISTSPSQLLANYFKIDLQKVELERRALLEAIRS